MRYAIVFLVLLIGAPACAQHARDWADDRPHHDPYWANRAFSESGTRIRNTPVYRPYSSYQERYNHYHRYRHYRPHHQTHEHAHHHGHRDRHHATKVYSHASHVHDRHGRCGTAVAAVGTEHYSEDEGKRAAIKSWMAEVRHKLGTEMMDINNAEDLSFRCVISTPGDRISDKIAQWTRGDLLKECRIVARPCRPEIDHSLPQEVVRNNRPSSGAR